MTKINICHSIFVKKLFASCLISGAVVAIAISSMGYLVSRSVVLSVLNRTAKLEVTESRDVQRYLSSPDAKLTLPYPLLPLCNVSED
ncbi:MAG: hypothetical protein V7K38_20270 [Nostoc sp.]|uniref:hypothetical protein n=1 Tax=Nostoc sp. TaxID=1180 RepID=UPI002FFCC8D1